MPRLFLLVVVLLVASAARAQAPETPYAFPVSNLAFTLPADWTGARTVQENQAPAQASYAFSNTNRASDLNGATFRVIVQRGLNPIREERWLRGQLLEGLDGRYTIVPLRRGTDPFPFAQGAALKTVIGQRSDTRLGYAYYTRVGQTFYAILVEAPEEVFRAEQETIVAILSSIRLGVEG